MTVIASGSSAQLVIAMLIVMANMLLVLKLGPFIDAADDVLAFTTSLQLMLTLLGGLLIATDDSSNKTYDPQFMDTAMILVQIPGFVGFLLSLLLLNPKIREKFNRCMEPVAPPKEMIADNFVPEDSATTLKRLRQSFINCGIDACENMVDVLKKKGLTELSEFVVQGLTNRNLGANLDPEVYEEFVVQVSGKYASAAQLDDFLTWCGFD